MTQMDVEIGEATERQQQEMMNAVHYSMRYIVKDGQDMSPEMIDIAMGVCSGVAQNSYGIPRISAMHMMSIMLAHSGQIAFAEQYQQIVAEEVERTQFVEQSGIEYQ